jgi:hypothetical protein
MATVVTVGFQTTEIIGDAYQLDSATRGILDGSTYVLGGLVDVDVSAYVLSVEIARGRSRQTRNFKSGVASVVLDNSSRIFDPLNTDSPYYPYISIRVPVTVTVDGVRIYTGLVTDWDIDYSIANQDRLVLRCADALTVLANTAMASWAPTEQLTGARVTAVLAQSDVAYVGPVAIQTGASTVGAYTVAADTNVLTYLQSVETSEVGYLFVDADGVLQFVGRSATMNPVSVASFALADISYQSLKNQFGDEELYNIVTATSDAGTATATDTASAAQFNYQSLQLDVLNSTVDELTSLAQYSLGLYATPVLRFTGLNVLLQGQTAPMAAIALGLDLTDVVSITKTFATGTPLTVTQTQIVNFISHSIRPGVHNVRYGFESTNGTGFVLDSATFGLLDTNILGF